MSSGELIHAFIHELFLKAILHQTLNAKWSLSSKILLCNVGRKQCTSINNAILKMPLCYTGLQLVVLNSESNLQNDAEAMGIYLALGMALTSVNH